MTRRFVSLVAASGSAALLAGAYIFQFLGYPPCAMCLWQRWPHFAAIGIGILAWRFRSVLLPWLGALAAATTGSIGIYHTGVERDWWEGPSSCSGGAGLSGLSGSDLLSLDGPRVVMCDQVSWELFTLSMASWNALLSLGLVAIWVFAARLPSR